MGKTQSVILASVIVTVTLICAHDCRSHRIHKPQNGSSQHRRSDDTSHSATQNVKRHTHNGNGTGGTLPLTTGAGIRISSNQRGGFILSRRYPGFTPVGKGDVCPHPLARH
ncbi:hypothetical protein DPEC_G00112020 [Dallia pectoralis]|uniref:Uncharacterized protein n=1 Tax=Dallia pectoralis TaxID=75939 RepID=A0ACC2GTA6_DALPE|nr:hypothetical protein DPEC_G00112020 [Dallia pectoralis]